MKALVLQDAASRVKSMMILYEKMYLSKNVKEISLQDYFLPLITEIVAIFSTDDRVQIITETADIKLDPKVLTPVGIILNEPITNAMKYAFTGRDSCLIRVTATQKDNIVTIDFADNGTTFILEFPLE